MKKLFTFALAAATLVGFSACSNDEENVLSDKGYINLNVSADQIVATRAAADLTQWVAVVKSQATTNFVFGTAETKAVINPTTGTSLAATPLDAGTYEVTVSSHQDEEAALAANEPYGEPYFEFQGKVINVTAGSTTNESIECGKSKNARFEIISNGFAGTALTVTVTAPREITFSKANNTISNAAFFAANQELTFNVDYTINGNTKNLTGKKFTLGGAGTNSKLTISSDQNGYISLTITYDDTFDTGTAKTFEINSADGSATENP